MAEKSNIEWTDATFNPWWGCARVSPGCDHCYAEALAHRLKPEMLWTTKGARHFFGDNHWNEPLRWDRKAVKLGRRLRVFCASMADVFDNQQELQPLRERLWVLIRATPHLDWLILTKRIGNAKAMLPEDWGDGYENVWLGASIVNQPEADRDLPKLMTTAARMRFVSFEPLLAPILAKPFLETGLIHWAIVGGESGHGAREMLGWWALQLRIDCRASGVAFFMKQGSQANWPKFKEFATFPIALQVREWPARSSS